MITGVSSTMTSERPTRSPPGAGPPQPLSVMVIWRYCPVKMTSPIEDWKMFFFFASVWFCRVFVIWMSRVSDWLKSVGLSDALREKDVPELPLGRLVRVYEPMPRRLNVRVDPRSNTSTGAPLVAI